MADKYQNEVTAMLHKYNVFVRHEKPIYKGIVNGKPRWETPDRSSPDLVGGLVHQINVEVKTCGVSFPFNVITEGQYEYAQKWRSVRGCEYWLAIMYILPYVVHGRIKRDLFLVPFPVLETTVKSLDGIQGSLPHKYVKGMRLKVRDKQLYATNLWALFRCQYFSDSKWVIPSRHPFGKMYFNQKPYLFES
jgi:hypothetical protein